jgi:hypothetical protein
MQINADKCKKIEKNAKKRAPKGAQVESEEA